MALVILLATPLCATADIAPLRRQHELRHSCRDRRPFTCIIDYLPRYHSLFRKLPPSTAATLAAKAPTSIDAASQSENFAADLRA